MNILKTVRKPYVAILMASLILFVSCEQHRLINDPIYKFDYSLFEEFKNNNEIQDFIQKIKSDNLNRNSVNIQNLINEHLDYDLNLPNEFLELSLNDGAEHIYNVALQNRWMNQSEFELSKKFVNYISVDEFDIAISNYEKDLLKLNLTEDEFNKHNHFLNAVKSVEYNNPELFENSEFGSQSPWRCLLAVVAFIATFVGLASCITVWACLLAYTLFINASLALADNCYSQDQ